MTNIYREVKSTGYQVIDITLKETVYKTHSVQNIKREVTQAYNLVCGHSVPLRYAKLSSKGLVCCQQCTSYHERKPLFL